MNSSNIGIVPIDLSNIDQKTITQSQSILKTSHRYFYENKIADEHKLSFRIQFDKNAYLHHTRRVPKVQKPGPLVIITDKFFDLIDPKKEILGMTTFEKITKARTSMNILEAFEFCKAFGMLKNNYITHPEIMILFAMTTGSDTLRRQCNCASKRKSNTVKTLSTTPDFQKEFLEEIDKFKGRSSKQLLKQRFIFFLCRLALVMFSREPLGNKNLSAIEKVNRFIEFFKLNNLEHVKKISHDIKLDHSIDGKKFIEKYEYQRKGTGLAIAGAHGYSTLKQYIHDILDDVDIAAAVQPFTELQLISAKRYWMPYKSNHLNMSKIYINSNLDNNTISHQLNQYYFRILVTNQHPTNQCQISLSKDNVLPKYLKVFFETKTLRPGMKTKLVIKLSDNLDVIKKYRNQKHRSFLLLDVKETYYQLRQSQTRKISEVYQVRIPISVEFKFMDPSQYDGIYFNEQLITPRVC